MKTGHRKGKQRGRKKLLVNFNIASRRGLKENQKEGEQEFLTDISVKENRTRV